MGSEIRVRVIVGLYSIIVLCGLNRKISHFCQTSLIWTIEVCNILYVTNRMQQTVCSIPFATYHILRPICSNNSCNIALYFNMRVIPLTSKRRLWTGDIITIYIFSIFVFISKRTYNYKIKQILWNSLRFNSIFLYIYLYFYSVLFFVYSFFVQSLIETVTSEPSVLYT